MTESGAVNICVTFVTTKLSPTTNAFGFSATTQGWFCVFLAVSRRQELKCTRKTPPKKFFSVLTFGWLDIHLCVLEAEQYWKLINHPIYIYIYPNIPCCFQTGLANVFFTQEISHRNPRWEILVPLHLETGLWPRVCFLKMAKHFKQETMFQFQRLKLPKRCFTRPFESTRLLLGLKTLAPTNLKSDDEPSAEKHKTWRL